MNINEFAHQCAIRLSNSPTDQHIAEIVNETVDFATENGTVLEETVYDILGEIESEIGDLMVVSEAFDIQKRLTVANKARQYAEQRLKAMRTKPTRTTVKKK